MHSPAPLNGLRLTVATAGGGAGDGNIGMGGGATEELVCTCDVMKALVIKLAKQARALRLPEPLRLEGALADGPLKYANTQKNLLEQFFFGWCFLYSQAMPRDFVCPTKITQIDKYK